MNKIILILTILILYFLMMSSSTFAYERIFYEDCEDNTYSHTYGATYDANTGGCNLPDGTPEITPHFLEKNYGTSSGSYWVCLTNGITRSTIAHSGNYSMTYDPFTLGNPHAVVGYGGAAYGNTSNFNLRDYASRYWYFRWYERWEENIDWGGYMVKLLYINYQNTPDFTYTIIKNGNGSNLSTLKDYDTYSLVDNHYVTAPTTDDMQWHKLELLLDVGTTGNSNGSILFKIDNTTVYSGENIAYNNTISSNPIGHITGWPSNLSGVGGSGTGRTWLDDLEIYILDSLSDIPPELGSAIIDYGFEDFDSYNGYDSPANEYIYSTPSQAYWNNHIGSSIVTSGGSACNNNIAHSGTYYHHIQFNTTHYDSCLGSIATSVNARNSIGSNYEYPLGNKNNTHLGSIMTGNTGIIRFWFRTTGDWSSAQDVDGGGGLKFIRWAIGDDYISDDNNILIKMLNDGDSETPRLGIFNPSTSHTTYYQSPINFQDGNWHSITLKAVRDRDDNAVFDLSLYIDDWEMSSNPAISQNITLISPGNGHFYRVILNGNWSAQHPENLMGMDIDDIQILDSASINFCNFTHLSYCTDQSSCQNAGGNWCNNTCQANPCSTEIRSDVNQDNQITSTDALLTLRKSLNLDMSQTNWQDSSTTGDVNCDNTTNSTDAMLILRKSLGLDMESTGWCVE